MQPLLSNDVTKHKCLYVLYSAIGETFTTLHYFQKE